MNIMKLVYRVSFITLILSVFVIVYFLNTPKKYAELNSWYQQQYKTKEQYVTMKPTRKKGSAHVKETNRLNEVLNEVLKPRVPKVDQELHKDKNDHQHKHTFDNNNNNNNNNINNNVHVTNHGSRLLEVEEDMNRVEINKELNKVKQWKIKFDAKLILIYTGLHNVDEWYNLPKSKLKGYLKKTKCKYKNCRITYNKELFTIADAVIFHERNMPSGDILHSLSKDGNRPESQRWIYFTSETPKNSDYSAIPYNGLFNWTMTYRVDSDIYLPYLQYRKLGKGDIPPDPNINYAKLKNQTIAWLVGNCEFEFRMEFVHALEQFTDVYVGGGCKDDFEKHIDCQRWCNSSLQNYKFFLALENGICKDYITEKYWKYLEQGLVPVVLGGANYSDPRLAIPGSYIDASAFNSIPDLAAYLKKLDSDDTAYNEYFKWKQKYKIWHPKHGDWPFESYFLCKICKMLQQNLPRKVYYKLSEFWDEYEDCQVPENKLRKKLVPEGYSHEARLRKEDNKARADSAKVPRDFDEEYIEEEN